MSWQHGKGFRITGYVVRKFVPPSGKCAFLTVETPGKSTPDKTEVVGFHEMVEEIGALGVGQVVQVTGHIGSKLLQNKARQDIEVDGRKVCVVQLIVKAIAVEGSSARPLTQPAGGAPAEAPPASSAPATRDWEKDDAEKGVIW